MIFLSSIKTKVAIKFPKKAFFFFLPKIGLALKGLIYQHGVKTDKNNIEDKQNVYVKSSFVQSYRTLLIICCQTEPDTYSPILHQQAALHSSTATHISQRKISIFTHCKKWDYIFIDTTMIFVTFLMYLKEKC